MPEILLSIPIAFLILLAVHEAGRLVLRALSREDISDDPLDNTLIRLASGFIALEFVVTTLAFFHCLIAPVLWVIVGSLAISAFVPGRGGRRQMLDTLNSFRGLWTRSRSVPLNAILATTIVVALLLDFTLTLVPTTAWDTLTYHYTLPAQWLRSGGFVPIPGNCYHELPCGSEMLFALAFALGGLHPDNMGPGALAANHITWAAGALSCVAFISIGRKLGDANGASSGKRIWDSWTPGLIAAIAFLSLPIVYVEEMEGGYIENFLVLFTLVMLILLVRFKETGKPSALLIVGIIAGGLLASKHTGLLVNALVLVILIVWIARMPKADRAWGKLVLAIILALVIPALWYLKSYLHTGDPAYPFITSVLRPDEPVPDIMYWSNPNVERSLWGFIAYIPRLSWDVSLVQFEFRLLSWYFLPLLPFTVFWSVRASKGRVIGLITWVLIGMIYLFAPGEPRYMLAAWGLYAGLGAWALFGAFERVPWITKLILPVLLVLPIACSLVERTREVNHRVPTIIGAATVEEYFLKSFYIQPLVRFINQNTSLDAGVVMVEPKVLYIQRPYIIWYPFPTEPTRDWDEIKPEELIARWRDAGMEFLMLTGAPNYRALTIAELASADASENDERETPFSNLLESAKILASYAESVLVLDEQGKVSISENWEADRTTDDFDYRSIMQIKSLYEMGFLEPVFTHERAGTIFRIVYQEGES